MLSKDSVHQLISTQQQVRLLNTQRSNEYAQQACGSLMQMKGKFDSKSLFDQMLQDSAKQQGVAMHFNDDAKARKEQIAMSKYSLVERERLGIDKDFRSVNDQEELLMNRKQQKELDQTPLSERAAVSERHQLERDMFSYQSAKFRFDHQIEGQSQAPEPSAALARMVTQHLVDQMAVQQGNSATALSRFAVNHPERKNQIQEGVIKPLQQMVGSHKQAQASERSAKTLAKLDMVLPQVHHASAARTRMRMQLLNPNMEPKLSTSVALSPNASKHAAQAQSTQKGTLKSISSSSKRTPKLISQAQMQRIDQYGKQYAGAQDFVARTATSRKQTQQGMGL